jgi:effector-binding domain-containing protein
MKLIIGKHLIEQESAIPNSFEQLSEFLNELGIAQETLECALVYILRLSGNYLQVS